MLFAVHATIATVFAQTSGTGLTVSVPNGYANISADDLQLQSTGGPVRWTRFWDGQEWKFNPHWESLSQSWKNLTGSQTADTTGATLGSSGTQNYAASASGGGADSGCWVWVDEDWQPTVGRVVVGGVGQQGWAMEALRTQPFNRVMGELEAIASAPDYLPPVRVNIDYAHLCMGNPVPAASNDFEAVRRLNELYLGEQGRYAFDNRSVLEKRAVHALPNVPANPAYATLGTGQIAVAPITIAKGYRWSQREGDWIDYNTQGQVVAYGDRNDNTVWLVRDGGGVLRGVVDANGHVLYTLHYAGPLIAEVRDYPLAGNAYDLPARKLQYQYDELNRLTQVTDVRGNATRYAYDSGNHVIKITDAEGHAEQLAYNGDTVKQRTTADGAVTDYVFEYDDTNKQFASKITGPETEAGRRVEDYTHNRVGKLVRYIVNGRTDEEVRYDTGARAELHTNARGFTTRVTKNEFGQVVEVDYPDGASIKRRYAALNLALIEETDELGIKTQYQYDAKGNLAKKAEAVGTVDERTTEYVVNSLGQTTQVARKGRIEANGTVTQDAVWQAQYDGLGQIAKITDPEGNVRLYVFDRAGKLRLHTDPLSHVTRYDTDAAGHITTITDGLGRVNRFGYDKVGNLISETDAGGKAGQLAYDAMNRLTARTGPTGGSYRIQYNSQGLPIRQTDEDGRSVQTEFDNFLRLSKEIDDLGNITEYGYNIPDGLDAGSLGALYEATETKYPSFTQRKRYDERERPTSQSLIHTNARGSEQLISASEYDKLGQVKSETDAKGKVRYYVYDALSELAAVTDRLGNKTQAQYDARGSLLQLTDARGNTTRFEYDRNGRQLKEVQPLGQTTQYAWDAAGRLVSRADPIGKQSIYSYDAANRLTEVKQYDAGKVLQRTTSYTWDAVDNLTAWTDTNASRRQTTSASASHDDANHKNTETITYPAGNTLGYGYAYSAAGYKTQLTWPDGTAIGYAYSGHGELQSVNIPGEGAISVDQYKWPVPTQITLPGGTTQSRSYDGLLDLESLRVKSPTQQTTLALSNSYVSAPI